MAGTGGQRSSLAAALVGHRSAEGTCAAGHMGQPEALGQRSQVGSAWLGSTCVHLPGP